MGGEAAKAQSSQASTGTDIGISISKPENKPVGSANTVAISDLDGNGFWLIEKVDTYVHIDYSVPNPKISDSDIESDNNNEASCTELAGIEDEQALDWFGSDDQLVTGGGIAC